MRFFTHRQKGARRVAVGLLAVGLSAGLLTGSGQAAGSRATWTSSFTADEVTYTATNHLTAAAGGPGREWLLAWTGPDDPSAPDFMAVIDATPGSRTYGKVANTVTMGPGVGNEPHHMQYTWHKGDRIYAGGILSDTTFVFDARALPALRLVGVNTPQATTCGTMPDAYQVLDDGTAYGSMLGGPNVTGPCTYTDGEVREGNGPGGSPGEIVHIGKHGETLSEIPAATAEGEDPAQCGNVPALTKPTCANPHGIAVREDLNLMVASDFVEARSVPSQSGVTAAAASAPIARQTVRAFDITDRDNPKLLSVSKVHDGPRLPLETGPTWGESRVIMETALPHKSGHRGAFVSSMAGGAVFYTPDITVPDPQWREILDDTAAYRRMDAATDVTGGGDNGSWLAISPDDRFLYHAVMGQSAAYGKPLDTTSGMLYVLDIQKLLAAGNRAACSVDELGEVYTGGKEADCPAVVSAVPIKDTTDGGPHWGSMDNFSRDRDGRYTETDTVTRIVTSDYFLAGSFGGGGDHRICMFDVTKAGVLGLDRTFRDEYTREPCLSLDRKTWPHGDTGSARAHGVLFVVSDGVLR